MPWKGLREIMAYDRIKTDVARDRICVILFRIVCLDGDMLWMRKKKKNRCS